MQVVPRRGTGDGTVFREMWHTSALVWTLRHQAGQEGTSLTKVWGEIWEWALPEPAVAQAALGRTGSGTPEQSSKRGKKQLHCRTWRGLHQQQSKGPSDKTARKDASWLRNTTQQGDKAPQQCRLGAVPNELSSANLPALVRPQLSISLQSATGNNVSSYWIRYLSFPLLLLEYEGEKRGEKERQISFHANLWRPKEKHLTQKILYHTFRNICLHNDKCINKSMELLQIQIEKWLNYMCTL